MFIVKATLYVMKKLIKYNDNLNFLARLLNFVFSKIKRQKFIQQNPKKKFHTGRKRNIFVIVILRFYLIIQKKCYASCKIVSNILHLG
jgi:hypothetical protein